MNSKFLAVILALTFANAAHAQICSEYVPAGGAEESVSEPKGQVANGSDPVKAEILEIALKQDYHPDQVKVSETDLAAMKAQIAKLFENVTVSNSVEDLGIVRMAVGYVEKEQLSFEVNRAVWSKADAQTKDNTVRSMRHSLLEFRSTRHE